MAINWLNEEQETESTDLDFAADYLKANPKEDKKTFEISELQAARSGKGYILRTDKFLIWLWKKQKEASQILEALTFYCDKGKGYALVCQLDKKAKNGFRLGVDTEKPVTWYETVKGKKYATTQDILLPSEVESSGNPFIHPVP